MITQEHACDGLHKNLKVVHKFSNYIWREWDPTWMNKIWRWICIMDTEIKRLKRYDFIKYIKKNNQTKVQNINFLFLN